MTKKLGVIGWPISHSFSPKLHNFISKELGYDYVYEAIAVKPEELGMQVNNLKNTGICGFNVTAGTLTPILWLLWENNVIKIQEASSWEET